ncbi:MAG: hypothetical protein HFH49_00365 [Lachnospiraceae bacterium]|nr:hypothetical protein [Lachnospiraceae bacterium]
MYGHTVEKSQLKGYNYNTLYTIGGIKMDRITQSMSDAFQNDFSLSFNDPALLFEYFSNYCVVNNIYRALALYKIENLFKTNKIDKKYRRSRYHAMMLFRIVVSKEEKPRFNQRKMELYCQNILDVLNNDYKCEKIFKGIVDFIISKGQDIDIENRKCFERKETTEYLLSQKGSLIEYLKKDNVIS